MNKRLVILIAASLGMLATFLPWVNIPFIGPVSGAKGDGWITFILYLIPLIICLTSNKNESLKASKRLAAIIPSIVAIIIAIWKIIDFSTVVSDANSDNPFASTLSAATSIGFGLYLVIIAGICLIIAALFMKDNMAASTSNSALNLFCSSCGKRIPPESKFCPSCGLSIPINPNHTISENQIIQPVQSIHINPNISPSLFSRVTKNIGFWGALLILISCFLPLWNVSYLHLFHLIFNSIDGGATYLLLIFPTSAAILILQAFTNLLPRRLCILVKFLPLVLILLELFIDIPDYVFLSFFSDVSEFPMLADLGMYGMLVGIFLMLFFQTNKRNVR